MNKRLLAGIDLHSNNLFCGIVDADGKRIFEKRLPCDLKSVVQALEPFRKDLETVAVESTYNWYWLVDGLIAAGFHTVLANPAGMQQYNGLKHADDKTDAFFLAEMLRLKILPTGHICRPEVRPLRDLLRRRLGLVHKRTSLTLSLKSLHTRMTGVDLPLQRIRGMEPEEGEALFSHSCDKLMARVNLELLEALGKSIQEIESTLLPLVKAMPSFQVLETIPGVGKILGLTITLETDDPKRFPEAGDFVSYCRCVSSRRVSNGKKKGENNSKCGNKYLGWAFVEAANFAKRHDGECRKYFDRKASQTNRTLATKALASKIAKASWHMMTENTEFDLERIFPKGKGKDLGKDLGKAAGKSQDKGMAKSSGV
jgi:transposase